METTSAPAGAGLNRWSGGRIARVIGAGTLILVSVACLVGGAWALWKDRVDRDSNGFVTIGTSDLRTQTYAIVGDLKGDGPDWLYGSKTIGDARVRATSTSAQPLFVGIARKEDVSSYLTGVGYAKIYGFEVTPEKTRPGGPPTQPPSDEPIWVQSTEGTGQQTLFWEQREGDWSVVFMNADAAAGVSVHGDAAAKLPILPWVALSLLLAAAASGFFGGRVLVRALRSDEGPAPSQPGEPKEPTSTPTPVGVAS